MVEVKSLNKTPGRRRRRFVFKSFNDRINEIYINVYRSLEKVKADPSEGSTFFRDCLIEWRELNTAEDFISLYEDVMPYTPTLSLVLHHKEFLISELLSRLHMKAQLSLEPILRLIAELSRDLVDDFLLLLPRIVKALVSLLESGGDKEPDIIEQIFTSWSYIMMYLQKYLIHNTPEVLKFTKKLRYYPKEYVQQFMAEAMSFVLRNAPEDQLQRGIESVIAEAVKKPSICKESGVEALLYNIVKGCSSRFHSKAERVLQLLTSKRLYSVGDKATGKAEIDSTGDKADQGSCAILNIVKSVFSKLCKRMEPEDMSLVWSCLNNRVRECVSSEDVVHLRRMLSVLVSAVKMQNRQKVSDYESLLNLVRLLVRMYITPSGFIKAEVIDELMELMLAILNGLFSSNTSMISECALQWAPIFKSRSSSLLGFIRELLHRKICVLAFGSNIVSAINDLMEISEEEAIHLLQAFFEKMQLDIRSLDFVEGTSAEGLTRIRYHLEKIICYWIGSINNISHSDVPCQIDEGELALLWGVVNCYSYMAIVEAKPTLLVDLVDAIDQLLTVKAGYIADTYKKAWESILGSALSSYNRLYSDSNIGADETGRFLSLAKRYQSSSQVLLAVADYLDCKYGSLGDNQCRMYHPELEEGFTGAMAALANNLRHSDKDIRISTLKILCHYKPLGGGHSSVDQPAKKRRKTEVSSTSNVDCTGDNQVLLLLHSIETTPISISTSRTIHQLISKIQMDLSAGRIYHVYVPVILNGLFGILNNKFSDIWNSVLECIAVLISLHFLLVWDNFVDYLERCQSILHTSCHLDDGVEGALLEQPTGLLDCFRLFVNPASDSTSSEKILSLLLQALQKIPTVIEPRSWQFIPLFLKFLGYNAHDLVSVGLFDSSACKDKDWKAVLKEWLNLLKLMKNPTFYSGQFLKEVLQNRLLEENDSEIQMSVLDCLIIWKDDYLLPYNAHLRNLISSKNLREELTTWSLSKESNVIEECQRAYLVPLVIRLLMPKIRRLKRHASRKKASICHRKAILSFIAELDVNELPLFFALLIKPLQIVKKTDGPANLFWTLPRGSISEFQASSLLEYFTLDNIATLSWENKFGFLHVIQDIVGVFDELHVSPFLGLLVGCVVRVLESCTTSLEDAKLIAPHSDQSNSGTDSDSLQEVNLPANQILSGNNLKQFRKMRSLCLKIVYLVLIKYEDHEFGSDLWDRFFCSVKPLVDKFKQEAASSEKPSSLLSCFVAMSANHKLVALFCTRERLVLDIFSIISVKSASEAVIYCVLKFVENLLSLDNQLDNEDNPAQRILLPNIKALMDSMCCLFGGDNAAKRKLIKSPGETVRRIFKFLPKYIKQADLAMHFVDILLLFIEKKTASSDVCVEALQIIQSIIPILGYGNTTKILSAVSPLYISAELDMRLKICEVLDALVASDASVLSVAKLLRQLNATSTLGWLDHDTILNAYQIINIDFFRSIQVEHALLILSHCVIDMSSEETTLMCSAYSSLLAFVDFCALILCEEGNSEQELSMMKDPDGCWTKSRIRHIAKTFLLKHVADATDGPLSVRKGWMKLLHQMVLKLPEVSNLKSLTVLCNEDGEVKFFDTITDSVIRQRVKALSWFRSVISTDKLSEFITEKVFMRLFFNMMFDEKDGKAEHMKNACIETIASIAGQMEWKPYYALLMRCFRESSSSPDKQKIFIHLVCCILDKYHFSELSNTEEPKESSGGVWLHKILFPKIQKLLGSDSDRVNINICLAALKLLKLVPGDLMDSYLSTIVHRISRFLKSDLESVRDKARDALAACLKELGLEYLQFIVQSLQSTLKRGYELHVLGYTLNFMLSKCLVGPVSGKIDYCLVDLLSVIENDIFGDVAEQKGVEKIASKMKETSKQKSFESLKLIAQSITLKSCASKLLERVKSHLQKHVTPKVKENLERMLHHIAIGIESNPSVDQTDLFNFVRGIIEDDFKDEMGLHENKLVKLEDKSNRINAKRVSTDHRVAGRLLCPHLITVFALRMLHKHMKCTKLDVKAVDPFVKLLSHGLCSENDYILSASLDCLTILFRLPLTSLLLQAERVKAALLDIAQRPVDPNSPLMQSCLRLLTVLLRNTKVSLAPDQIHSLAQLPIFIDLETNPSLVALSLLKSIVSRKLNAPEIYDRVTKVAELMVTSQTESIRKNCRKILLQFLLHYPLSKERRQQHLNGLLSNLKYEHSSGRESVLEMIRDIIAKFRKSVLDEQSQLLFLHLVDCLANDSDSTVRSMIEAAIEKLIGSVSPNSLNSILKSALTWYLGDEPKLWGAAAKVLGLLIEVVKKGFRKHINDILPATYHRLTDKKMCFSAEPLLVMIEKMIHQFHDLCLAKDLEEIWEVTLRMLSHPHSRIRNKSVRLIALYFVQVTEACRKNRQSSLKSYFLMSPSRLFLIASSLCWQLKKQLIDDAEGKLMTQTIVFAICGVHSLMSQMAPVDPSAFWSTLEQDEKDRFSKAFKLLDSRNVFVSSSFTSSLYKSSNKQAHVYNTQHVLVLLLLRKMGEIALLRDVVQMGIVFNSFGNIMSQISQDDCIHYADVVLFPLYKVSEGYAGKVVSDDMKKLAENECEKIENILGTQNYVQAYNGIRNNLKLKRNKRKLEEKLMAVINPMRNAKRKSRVSVKHSANKKRKIMTFKMGRWMR